MDCNEATTVNVLGNKFKSIENPNEFENFNKLTSLNMNDNEEFNFVKNQIFLNHSFLNEFQCSNCGIDEVGILTFSKLPELKTLDLSKNKITTIDESAFVNNEKLNSLDLSNNQLVILPENLSKSLEILILNENLLFDLPKSKIFIFSNNFIKFECNGCGITFISKENFKELSKLKELSLNNNNISFIEDGSWNSNSKLNYLNLENNSLITFDFGTLSSIKELCLDGNNFESSLDNNHLKIKYETGKFRGQNCQKNESIFFEKILKNYEEIAVPKKVVNFAGISDAFISSYLVLMVLIQGGIICALLAYFFKIRSEKCNGYYDYSMTILNEHDLYKID